MFKVNNISSRKILDSRSDWTIETAIALDDITSTASVPGGTSKSSFEAKALDVSLALEKMEFIKKSILGRSFESQQSFDNFLISLDGTADKSNLGANTILSLSLAFAKASAKKSGLFVYQYIARLLGIRSITKPKIMMLVFEGGKHGEGSFISIQEFMVVSDTIDSGDKIYDAAKDYLLSKSFPVEVGLEGAFSVVGLNNIGVLSILRHITPAPIALDVAASSSEGSVDYDELIGGFNVSSIEDPITEDDWVGWGGFNEKFGGKILVVGDDLIATNPERIRKAADLKACNAVVIKPDQIGTLSETLESITLAKQSGMKIVVSHRSGETNDNFIADLAAGSNADYVKFGAPSRGERVAKYNRLLEIFPDI